MIRAMSYRNKSIGIAATLGLMCSSASAGEPIESLVPAALLSNAMAAYQMHEGDVSNPDFVTIIDYRQHSSDPRFYLIDQRDNTADVFLVAHGKGSDLDHDGYATQFSNTPNSKMTSLGAFVTGEQYYGRHGISLKLHGLETRNDQAEARYIVIHGAAYVNPARSKMGRSWGCPALEQEVAKELIPQIKGGSFVYIVGPTQKNEP